MDAAKPMTTDRLIDEATRLSAEGGYVGEERRNEQRRDYDALVGYIGIAGHGERSRVMILRAKDISLGGMRVVSRQMIHVGQIGAVQLARSDGRVALVGVRVQHCRYVGDMVHETGLQFVGLPAGVCTEDFMEDGQMVLFDPVLRMNRRRSGPAGESVASPSV